MIEQDDELRKLLRKWEAPAPRPSLDSRVWSALRQAQTPRLRKRSMKWFPIAAGVLLAGLAMHLWQGRGPERDLNIESRTNAVGFEPMSNGAITVVKVKPERKQ